MAAVAVDGHSSQLAESTYLLISSNLELVVPLVLVCSMLLNLETDLRLYVSWIFFQRPLPLVADNKDDNNSDDDSRYDGSSEQEYFTVSEAFLII